VPIKGSVDDISDEEDGVVEEDDDDEEEDEEDESEVEDDDEDEEVRRRVFYACRLLKIRAYRRAQRKLIPQTSDHDAREAYASIIRPRKPSPRRACPLTKKKMTKWSFSYSLLNTGAPALARPFFRSHSVLKCYLMSMGTQMYPACKKCSNLINGSFHK
jgi:hypothetical protein